MTRGETSTLVDLAELQAAFDFAAIEHHHELTSTNDRAAELAADKALCLPVLIVADRQTAGRGRGGNRWWSAPGGLTFSLIVELEQVESSRWPQLSLTAATAICDLLGELVPGMPSGLKWPNDVHVGGRKISGILTEIPGGGNRAIIGVGLNVNNSFAAAPAELHQVGTALCDLTGHHYGCEVLTGLFRHLGARLRQWRAGESDLARRWHDLCLLRGRRVTLAAGNQTSSGYCAGIDVDGSLVLQTRRGEQKHVGGTVHSID